MSLQYSYQPHNAHRHPPCAHPLQELQVEVEAVEAEAEAVEAEAVEVEVEVVEEAE